MRGGGGGGIPEERHNDVSRSKNRYMTLPLVVVLPIGNRETSRISIF